MFLFNIINPLFWSYNNGNCCRVNESDSDIENTAWRSMISGIYPITKKTIMKRNFFIRDNQFTIMELFKFCSYPVLVTHRDTDLSSNNGKIGISKLEPMRSTNFTQFAPQMQTMIMWLYVHVLWPDIRNSVMVLGQWLRGSTLLHEGRYCVLVVILSWYAVCTEMTPYTVWCQKSLVYCII